MLIIHAHPRPSQSRVIKRLQEVLVAQPGAELRSLYELYPDFDIDVEAEQQALLRWQKIIWLTPVHWYSVPSLMKHWIDQVLTLGWAYGHGGEALRGKTCWWVKKSSPKTILRPYACSGKSCLPLSKNLYAGSELLRM